MKQEVLDRPAASAPAQSRFRADLPDRLRAAIRGEVRFDDGARAL